MKYNLLFLFAAAIVFVNACDNNLTDSSREQISETGKLIYDQISMAKADISKIPPKVQKRYRRDAEDITAILINRKDSTQIKLPKGLIDIIYNGIMHIYNSDSEEANEVTEKYEIHRAVNAGVSRRLLLTFSDSQAWQKAWKKGKLLTGNKNIDELLKKYNLVLDEFLDWSFPWNGATFHSKNPLNHIVLADKFRALEEIKNASPNSNIIDGDNIKVNLKENYIQFEFSDGFGDCMAGCIGRHYWTFKVFYSDGRVEFVKEYGTPLK